jgi:enamine deaminase RidA (YjgF/YER057c/UK114 family)
MQLSLKKVAPQAARNAPLLLSCVLAFIPLAAPAAADHAATSLRATRRLQDHQDPPQDALDAEPVAMTTAVPTTTDIGKARVREAQDIAWKAAGEATKARAATSKFRARINKLGAQVYSDKADKEGKMGTDVFGPQAEASEAAAKLSLTQTLATEDEVKKVLNSVDEHAFRAAQDAAAKEVAKLEMEAKKYFQSLLARFKALADPGPPTAAQAAAKAAQPYIDVELRVGALVQYYNEKAAAEIVAAQSCAFSAKNIAMQAQAEQTAGVVDMAQRHMMHAHMLVGAANMKKEGAYKIRKLAESLNMSIPSYQRAAQMAAAHALATFSGLQVGDKAHVEMRQKVAESTRQVDQALAALEATLKEATQSLEVVTSAMSLA